MADRQSLSFAISQAVSRPVTDALESALPQATNEVCVSSIQYYVPLT